MMAMELAVLWMTRNDCGRAAVGVRNSVVSVLDGAERCQRGRQPVNAVSKVSQL
jgi:hypothetical protein